MRSATYIMCSILSLGSGCASTPTTIITSAPSSAVRPSAPKLRNPFTEPRMLYGKGLESRSTAYVVPAPTVPGDTYLVVSCSRKNEPPRIDIDGEGAALFCGRWALWHPTFTAKLSPNERKVSVTTQGKASMYLKIPGVAAFPTL